MDIKRIFIYAALALVSVTMMSTWQKEQMQKAQQQAVTQSSNSSPSEKASPSTTNATKKIASSENTETAATSASLPTENKMVPSGRVIHLRSDVLDIGIDTKGGRFVSAKLLSYMETLEAKDKPFTLFTTEPQSYYTASMGIANGVEQPINYNASSADAVLREDQQSVSVVLTGKSSNGLDVTKTITLNRGKFDINVELAVKNSSSKVWKGKTFSQITQRKPETKGNSGYFGIHSYSGASISDPANKLFEKVSFKQMAESNFARPVKGGWVAMQQHYFLSAWVPVTTQDNFFYSREANNELFTIGMNGPEFKLAPGESYNYQTRLYAGPEITADLKELAPGLNLTIDYGLLWFISAPIFWVMKHIYSVVGNWGWAIILITVLIKLVFYKLSATSYRSMAAMRKLQPKIEALKERYGDDKQKLSQATMELYKKEKVNPLGGCLPILIQIPVFIALYWVLLESVELRHAPFMLWIRDLSAPDPFYILPILMGLSMLVQQRLNPAPPDPVQAKVMMLLPVFFTFLFLHFPSGLVLYWVVNNVISIIQQWYIMRKYDGGFNMSALAEKKK